MRLMIYGFVIIILFLGFRRGIVPTVTGWLRRSRRRSSSRTSQQARPSVEAVASTEKAQAP
jgi:hypothetical protein